jgi:hypothetical protein
VLILALVPGHNHTLHNSSLASGGTSSRNRLISAHRLHRTVRVHGFLRPVTGQVQTGLRNVASVVVVVSASHGHVNVGETVVWAQKSMNPYSAMQSMGAYKSISRGCATASEATVMEGMVMTRDESQNQHAYNGRMVTCLDNGCNFGPALPTPEN